MDGLRNRYRLRDRDRDRDKEIDGHGIEKARWKEADRGTSK